MTVLVADDEAVIRETLKEYLGLSEIDVALAEDGVQAQRRLEERAFDAAVIDLRMPGQDGLALLTWIRGQRPRMPVVMVSAHGEVADAVSAMKLGAEDYVVKPFDPEELLIRLRKLVDASSLKAAAEAEKVVAADYATEGGLGRSPAAREVDRVVSTVAPKGSTVLVTGESGTGKELVARSIHRQSGRRGPFVAVNAGGIPDSLLESELFGYEKGAFTGAAAAKPGMFELATRGTLFLDEIGEMPAVLQVKLLRAVQDKRIQRLGATELVPIDVRMVAATNRDLEQEVAEGRFRQDLYYRLNVIRIEIPPLRDRIEDLPLLITRILDRLNAQLGTGLRGVAPGTLEALRRYRFPGNVRELENMLERAAIFAAPDAELVEISELPALVSVPALVEGAAANRLAVSERDAEGGAAVVLLRDVERRAIRDALASTDGNRTRAAELLGISRRTLFNKLREYGDHDLDG